MHTFCSSFFSSTKVFRQELLPLKTRQLTPFWLLMVIKVIISYDNFIAIDPTKKIGGDLVFLIFTDKNFIADNRELPEWKPGLREKISGSMIDI